MGISRRERRQAGFTLLEVMVAFVIAALGLGVLYQGALGGLLQARVAVRYEEAISRAQSRLASIGHGSAIVPGDQEGEDGGGFFWRTQIAVAEIAPGPASPGAAVPTLYAVRVAISWTDGGSRRVLQLDTTRAGFSVAAAP